MSFKEISECPCENCIDKETDYRSKNCVNCCAKDVKGWPNFRQIKGMLNTESFTL